jgi:fructan beta-fructosidase
VWVLIVNLNPGGPNGGSSTQYFLGDFDGKTFTSSHTDTRWLDYGPDDYAGITWSNTGNRKIFLGWMSNWLYANLVPTKTWRNATTLPRELKLLHTGKDLLIASQPVKELSKIQSKPVIVQNLQVMKDVDLSTKAGKIKLPCRLNINLEEIKDISFIIANDAGEELVIGYEKDKNQYFIDRSKSGKSDFHKEFAARHVAPRFTGKSKMNISLLLDVSSVELFADDGLTVMTSVFFPNKPYNKIIIRSADAANIKKLEYISFNSIWK